MAIKFTKLHRPELTPEIQELVNYFIGGTGLTADIAKTVQQSRDCTEKQRLVMYNAKNPRIRSYKAYPSSFDEINGQEMFPAGFSDWDDDIPF